MCYLVAKKFNHIGSIALKAEHGKKLADFKRKLSKELGYDDIQLVTISRPSAYGEYEPYQFVHSYDEFEKTVRNMI